MSSVLPSSPSPSPSLPSPSAKMKSEFGWLIAVTLVTLAAVTLFLSAIQYHHERITTLQVLESSTAERGLALNALLAAAVQPITALRESAEDHTGPHPESPPDEAPADLSDAQSIQAPTRRAPIRQTPLVTALVFQTTEGSAAPHSDDTTTPESVLRSAQEARPEANPDRHPVWSPVYQGTNADTVMVGYAEPAYRNDRFVGVAAAEIALTFLHHVLQMPDMTGQRMVLVDRSRHVLADSWIGSTSGHDATLALGEVLPTSLVPDRVFSADHPTAPLHLVARGYTVLVMPLDAAPWVLVCLVPEGALFLRIVPWLAMAALLILGCFAALTFAQFSISRRFVKPALTLIRLVSAEAAGEILPPQRVPLLWQPWFTRVTGAFADSRARLAQAEAQITEAHQAVLERSQESDERESAWRHKATARTIADAILDHAPTAILVLDAQVRIVRFNRRCEELSGMSAAVAHLRHPWHTLIPPDQAAAFSEQVAQVLRGAGPIVMETPGESPDGTPRRNLWTLAALIEDNTEAIRHVIAHLVSEPLPSRLPSR